ncbi:hypothetical protein G6F63_012542 [Rhizopus arrhizus]|nr:hypothetical protein G6F63_012542 [Rhizopus arrhizus]
MVKVDTELHNQYRISFTNYVKKASKTEKSLTAEEMIEGKQRLMALIDKWQPQEGSSIGPGLWKSKIEAAPHVHIVLWTGKIQEELLDLQDLVVAQQPDQLHDPDLYVLVSKHQVHDCRPYCLSHRYKGDEPQPNQRQHSRFGFPFEPCPKSYFDTDNRKVLSYLAKYMSKADSDVHLHYHVETSQEHLKARMIGAVEAVYHICVWYLHM